MPETCEFSVVIPLYNKEDTIIRTLQSVSAQVYRDFEIIIIDDGSRDRSVQVVENALALGRFPGLKDIDVRLVRQPNQGVSSARNHGARLAIGQFVAFLDADDEWNSEFLWELHRIVVRYPHANVIGTDYAYVKACDIISGLDQNRIDEIDFFDEWAWRTPINSSSAAIRKTFYDECGGYNPAYRYYEDAELLFRMALKSRFHVSRRVLCRYNSDAQNRATGFSHDVSDYPHWRLADALIAQGTAPDKMVRCVVKEQNRMMIGAARCLNVGVLVKLSQAYPNIFRRLRLGGCLKSRAGSVLLYPVVLVKSLILRQKMRSRFNVMKKV